MTKNVEGAMYRSLHAAILLTFLVAHAKLQAPKKDLKFWNNGRILSDEPRGQWPVDSVKCLYVQDWSYWFRKKGMQTSTDDVIVAFVASYPEFGTSSSLLNDPIICSDMKAVDSKVNCYVDLGCGVGSTLLLVSSVLRPKVFSIGVEAQEQSVRLLQRTIQELPNDAPLIMVAHEDIRGLNPKSVIQMDNVDSSQSISPLESLLPNQSLAGQCDLITANPPYAPLQSGTLCKDSQRRSARFELRGGVEEYLVTAEALLSASGRFVLAFWSRDDDRVMKAVAAVETLEVHRRFDVLMGESGRSDPHLSVYDIRFKSPNDGSIVAKQCEISKLDITRDPVTMGLNNNYKAIRSLLGCAARPLKERSNT